MTEKPDLPKQIRRCDDCGQEYEGYSFSGAAISHYCEECRSMRVRAFDLDRQQERLADLANHRNLWLTDPVRGIPGRFQNLTWPDFKYDQGGEKNRAKIEELLQPAAPRPPLRSCRGPCPPKTR